MLIRILGPLEVWDGTGWQQLSAPKCRALLAILAIHAGETVPIERLIFLVWGDQPPRTAATQVHGFVGRLRRLLRDVDADRLRTVRPGYQLVLGPDDLDATVFESRARQGAALLDETAPGYDAEQARSLLFEALDLWRGSALADVGGPAAVRVEADRLEELRLATLGRRIESDLELGRHHEVIAELAALADANPYTEDLWRQLMVALCRSGRQADALQSYQRLRTILDEELGIDPSPAIRQLQQQILSGDPELSAPDRPKRTPSAAVPRQLPAGISDFVGRDDQLAGLDLLSRDASSRIIAITGMGGAGKSALALHWAASVADDFPDGQLYVELRGYSGAGARPPLAIAHRLLRSLGSAGDPEPVDLDEAAARLRSLLADRRILILLDDAVDADQVRPLLPGASSCLTLITSRNRLTGLVATDGAAQLQLDPLTEDQSTALLTELIGAPRVAREPDAAAELAASCDHLPLAIRIVGAQLVTHRDRRLADEVTAVRTSGGLAALTIDGDPLGSVRGVFDASFGRLSPAQQRLFRLLGLARGVDLAPAAAAALLGTGTATTARLLLDQLVDVSLLQDPHDHYQLHDLLGLYAAEQADQLDDSEHDHALHRLFEWYRARCAQAARVLKPHGALVIDTSAAEGSGPQLADPAAAQQWFDDEITNLITIVGLAAERDHPAAWLLSDALGGYFLLRRQISDWRSVAHLALRAATGQGELLGSAAAELALTQAWRCSGDYAAAMQHGNRAVELCRAADWVPGEVEALNELAIVYGEQGLAEPLATNLERALALEPISTAPLDRSALLMNLGVAHLLTGDLDRACEQAELARALQPASAPPSRIGTALANVATVYRMLGRYAEAHDLADQALEIQRGQGFEPGIVMSLDVLARIELDTGRPEQARRRVTEALGRAQQTGSPRIRTRVLLTAGAAARQPAQARDHCHQALLLAVEHANRQLETEARIGLAEAMIAEGDLAGGGAEAETAQELAREYGYRLLRDRAASVLETALART